MIRSGSNVSENQQMLERGDSFLTGGQGQRVQVAEIENSGRHFCGADGRGMRPFLVACYEGPGDACIENSLLSIGVLQSQCRHTSFFTERDFYIELGQNRCVASDYDRKREFRHAPDLDSIVDGNQDVF